MQSKQYFTKIKNYPHEKSTEPLLRPITVGRMSHYGRTYVPLQWDVHPIAAGRNNLSFKKP